MTEDNTYEARKAARIERLKSRAEGARVESAQRYGAFKRIADFIPFGQPILTDHYSAKRHRKDIDRMRVNADKSVELTRLAETLERQARSAASNRMVSSDDPDAVDKLQTKLAKLEAQRDFMKRFNAALRKGKTDAELVEAFAQHGLTLESAAEFRKPDSFGYVGFPAYKLTNIGSEIRRLKQRTKGLEAKAEAPVTAPEQYGEITIEESDNRVRVRFPGKPSADVRAMLRSHGFVWSPTSGAWQRMASADAWYQARLVANKP